MTEFLPWESAPHLPWKHFLSPLEQWSRLPSFLIGEAMFVAAAITAFVHAWKQGRSFLLVWLAALVAGTANDLIFMALPLVDNFWQAQATIMLTPRLPLYIPCVYICFLYYPTIAARRLGLPPVSGAAAAGLIGCLFYAPYDIVGAKFLWWTWHDTDSPIAARILGAPVSSSLWVLTFVSSFAWLVRKAVPQAATVEADNGAPLSAAAFLRGLAIVAGLTTALMLVQITIIQQIDGGAPRYASFFTAVLVYLVLAARGVSNTSRPVLPEDTIAKRAVLGHFATLGLIMAVFSPETHISTGVHQTPGECYVEAIDVTGLVRHKYLCVEDYEEDFTFECAERIDGLPKPADGSQWYTVCGRPHTNYPAHLLGTSGLCLAGAGIFFFLLGAAVRQE